MGDAVVSALVSEVVRTLTAAAMEEFALFRGFKGDILALKKDFDLIQAVLEDAEEKHTKEKAVELWLRRLRSASLKVEDVLDEVKTEALLQRLHKEMDIERGIKIGIKYKVKDLFSKVKFRLRAAHKVKAIRTKLDDLASKRLKLNLTASEKSHVDVGVEGEMPHRETSSLIHDSTKIVGRNEEVDMVTRTICNKDIGKYDNGEIRVYGIWGMGGIGKTTLAQLVYNHHRVDQYFDLKCWVHVSQNFQVKEITKNIIESVDKSECTLTQLETLQESLQSKLRGRKFVIVLDDVWLEDDEKAKWDQLSESLSCGAEESIVVMTTRSSTTSLMMAKVRELQHELGCLSEENSWLLFKKLAFAQGRVGDHVGELEPIGREIVEKCKGLPLAVKTLGGLMWSKRSTRDWQQVKDSIIWNLQEINVLPALRLSYDNLLPYLKRCFAYCCLFPKGHDIEKDVVIQLWMSNGLIPPREGIDLYVLGEEIFNCLVWRSFFIINAGKIVKRYKMHDLMHDMARYVMRHDCLVIEPTCNKVEIPDELLHLSSSCSDEKFFYSSEDSIRKLTSLRSLFMFEELDMFGEVNQYNFSKIFNHVHLRVLYLARLGLREFPESICKLKHLKYLKLSHSSIEVLPESIMYLQNLEVLDLSYCRKLCKLHESVCKVKDLKCLDLSYSSIELLPEGLKNLTKLQRLMIESCNNLKHLPVGIKELTSLRILSIFPVGNESGAKIGELGDLNLLEEKLRILRLENVGGLGEARGTNLKCKRNLSTLQLIWSDVSRREVFAYNEDVLEGLEPNPTLKVFEMISYMGNSISPSWMDKLRNLVRIGLNQCTNCEHIGPLGRLPNLQAISLWNMHSLKCFHDDDTKMSHEVFLCLQKLDIYKCTRFVSLPSNLPKLKVLRLRVCNELVSLPDEIQSFKDLDELTIINCEHLNRRYRKERGADWSKISHIPNINIMMMEDRKVQWNLVMLLMEEHRRNNNNV